MFSSNSACNGFSAVGQEELQEVNGGIAGIDDAIFFLLGFLVGTQIAIGVGGIISKSK